MVYIDRSYPLVELHRHLDGNVRLETILEIGLEKDLGLPATTLEGLRPHVQVTDPRPGIPSFFEKFKWQTLVMVDLNTCSRIAYENVADAYSEGIDYIELRFSPWFMAETHGLDPYGVVEAVVDGVLRGQREFPVSANLIGIISRSYGVEICFKELDTLIAQKEHICALDLAGVEKGFPAKWFQEHFRKGLECGWHSCPHAGEGDGPHSIWQAIEYLHAERIGHAVAAREDPKLMDYLAEHGIGVESNLTSNVQTMTVPDYASHPIGTFLDHGIKASLSTDDPGISGNTIGYEYKVAAEESGLSLKQLRLAQRNALDCAFLTKEEKETLIAAKNS